jgi:hypothetical protein
MVSVLAVAVLSAPAAGQTRFGARLDPDTQPSNAERGVQCLDNKPGAMCSWVLMDAYQREADGENGHEAPQDGRISKVRLISCVAGSFVLQIARIDPTTGKARVVRTGPLINYGRDPERCEGEQYRVQTYPVNVPVRKGDYLAVVAPKVGFMRCSSGGDNTLLFAPPLADRRAFRPATDGEGCWLLLEAEYAE